MNAPSLLRIEEHKALAGITLSGRVLDAGGDKNSEYLRFVRGKFETVTLNADEKAHPDIVHDLETPLPMKDGTYDAVMLMNVLEHIFNYRQLLAEAARVLTPGGQLVVVVPFLFPIHPSPQDYRRFTDSALRRELSAVGLHDISIRTLGRGVFSVRYALLDRLLPKPLRVLCFYTCRYIAYGCDWALARLAHALGKKYNPGDYALGYCATARKS